MDNQLIIILLTMSLFVITVTALTLRHFMKPIEDNPEGYFKRKKRERQHIEYLEHIEDHGPNIIKRSGKTRLTNPYEK